MAYRTLFSGSSLASPRRIRAGAKKVKKCDEAPQTNYENKDGYAAPRTADPFKLLHSSPASIFRLHSPAQLSSRLSRVLRLHRGSKGHIQQMETYTVEDVTNDLLTFAARHLTMGGRLVFLFPTTCEYKDSDLTQHPCLRVVANSEQHLQSMFRRRLITMQKIREFDPALAVCLGLACLLNCQYHLLLLCSVRFFSKVLPLHPGLQ